MFPHVGNDRWFAEGLASYLQYFVMHASGQLTWLQAVARIEERFARVRSSRVDSNMSVLEHNRRLREYRDYPRLYWGGAAYFANVDRGLYEKSGQRLTDVIARYVGCCYQRS